MKTGMETVYIETGIAGLSLVEMKFIYPSENSTGIKSNFLCAAAGDRDRGIRRVGLALIAKVPAPPGGCHETFAVHIRDACRRGRDGKPRPSAKLSVVRAICRRRRRRDELRVRQLRPMHADAAGHGRLLCAKYAIPSSCREFVTSATERVRLAPASP